MTIGSVYDTLTSVTEDGKVVPYLADTVTPNADYTVWTFHARDGVKFHDGTPFDGAAMVDNMKRQYRVVPHRQGASATSRRTPTARRRSSLTDPMTMTITMKRPWVVFPLYLAAQPGMIASPTWLAAADKDPTLESKPVGTGPFVFKDYKPGESFTATKNPDYWNKPYPYLDEFETRVIPDALTRASALEAGDVDLIQTTNGDTIKKFRGEADKFPMLEETDYGETGYTLLNVGDPTLAARRPAGALRHGVRHRQPGDHRQGRCRRLDDRERSVLTGAGRPPRRQRLPAEAGHGQGAGARRGRTRPTIRAR